MKNAKRKTSKACPRTLRGFSLGEAVLAVFLLTAGIVPVIAALSDGFSTSLESQELIIASGLAQEGVELVRNVKDNTILDGGTAFDAFSNQKDCKIDYNDVALSNPSSANKIDCSSGPYTLVPDGNGFYDHDTSGKFNRRIYLDAIPLGAGITAYNVISAVYWGDYGNTPTNLNTIANLKSNCKASKSCVYSEATLYPWK